MLKDSVFWSHKIQKLYDSNPRWEGFVLKFLGNIMPVKDVRLAELKIKVIKIVKRQLLVMKWNALVEKKVTCNPLISNGSGYKQITIKFGNGTPLIYSCLENPMDGGA